VTDIREILRRVQLGEPDRRIARDLGVSRNTVAHYRLWAERHGVLAGPLPEPGVLAALVQPAPQDRPAHEQSLVERFRRGGHRRVLTAPGLGALVMIVNTTCVASPGKEGRR